MLGLGVRDNVRCYKLKMSMSNEHARENIALMEISGNGPNEKLTLTQLSISRWERQNRRQRIFKLLDSKMLNWLKIIAFNNYKCW